MGLVNNIAFIKVTQYDEDVCVCSLQTKFSCVFINKFMMMMVYGWIDDGFHFRKIVV